MENNANSIQEAKKSNQPVIISVFGVGGGGSNVVNYIYQRKVENVELIVANTDAQALEMSPVPIKLQLGPETTHGLGAGAKPEVGAAAARESENEINKLLRDEIKLVFVTGGMGGGTGTGAAPVIAEMAKKKNKLVVGVVTFPFDFEGSKKRALAEEGIKNLSKYCDTLIIIENERLVKHQEALQANKKFSLSAAFALADEVLLNAFLTIALPITKPGVINVDYHDMHTILDNAGYAVMGTGLGRGEDRGIRAAKQAITSPLLRYSSIKGANRLLLTVSSGLKQEITLPELSEITAFVKNVLDNDDVMTIWGHSYEKELGEEIRVSVIASGFPGSRMVDHGGMLPENMSHSQKKNFSKSKSNTALYPENQRDGVGFKTMAQKIRYWNEQAQHRVENIEIGDDYQLTEKEIKDLSSRPTYLRKNIPLTYTPFTAEEPVRYRLDGTTVSEEGVPPVTEA